LNRLKKPVVRRRKGILNKPATQIQSENVYPLANALHARTRLHLVPPQKPVDVDINLPPGLPLDGAYITIKMHTERLLGLGIPNGHWAVVLCGTAATGDPVAVRKIADPSSYSVGYLTQMGQMIRLEAGCSHSEALYFNRDEVVIEGRIVAGCEPFSVNQARRSEQTHFRLKGITLDT
jgi:hypothetical protein